MLFATNLLVLGFSFFLYKILPHFYGHSVFYEFAYVKRYQIFLLPVLMAGAGVTLPKKIAEQPPKKLCLIVYALTVTILVTVTSFALLYLLRDRIFNTNMLEGYSLLYVACLSIPLVLSTIIFSYYRGLGKMLSGCAGLLGYGIGIPIFSLSISSNFYEYVLHLMVFTTVASVSHCAYLLWFDRKTSSKTSCARSELSAFAKDGFIRVPGDLGMQLILILPIFLLGSNASVGVIGSLSFLITLLGMAAFPFKPLSTLLLTEIVREGAAHRITGIYKKTVGITCFLSVSGALLFLLISGPFLRYFGADVSQTNVILFAVAMGFYVQYVALRSFVDGLGAKSETTIIMIGGLFTYVVVYIFVRFFNPPVGVASFSALAVSLALIASMLHVRSRLHVLKK